MRTTVGIIGAGPAGLLLARLLHNAGIDAVVLESRDRAHVEQRQRAGVLEQGTVDVLRAAGAGERMDREGLRHDGIELRFDRRRQHIDFPALTGGRSVTVYARTEVCKDLVALQPKEGGPLLFEAEALAVEGAGTDRPSVRFRHEGREDVLVCDYVVGCDGFRGVARRAIPASVSRVFERTYPLGWLGILADVPPRTTSWSTPATTAGPPCCPCAPRPSPVSTSRCRRTPTPRSGATSGSGTSSSGGSRRTTPGPCGAGRSPGSR